MRRFLTVAMMGVGLSAMLATTPGLRAQERDRPVAPEARRHEEHEWNEREEKAYRAWMREQHRKYVAHERLKDEERARYWEWRRAHDDEKLHIH